jgi:hypothetical protein
MSKIKVEKVFFIFMATVIRLFISYAKLFVAYF